VLRRELLRAGATLLLAAPIFTITRAKGNTIMSMNKGRYASVNGIDLYYERHGAGAPLILLHGGLGTIDAIFGRLLPALAARCEVIAVELQGHGHTADNGREMTYQAMADDIAALIAELGLGRADVAGYSVGGGVTLQLGLRHPGSVRKLVVISAPHATEGWFPEVLAGTAAMDPAAVPPRHRPDAISSPSSRPGDWPLLVHNVARLMASKYDWSAEITARMKAPLLVINGDADSVRPSHAVALYELLGGGRTDGFATGHGASQLLIVPQANHLEILDRTALPPAILDYLARDTAATKPFTVEV
jgi:pimeloyl-ACP methyl ester carboxylesterase